MVLLSGISNPDVPIPAAARMRALSLGSYLIRPGTTLVQANELSLHAAGIDISAFNSLIASIKAARHDIRTILFSSTVRCRRTVLTRVEKDRSNACSEILFHLKERYAGITEYDGMEEGLHNRHTQKERV
jgi:hypothetical protein